MKRTIYILLCAAILITACGQQQSNSSGNNATNSQTNAQPTIDGKELFMSNCASCHRLLTDATGPALAGSIAHWNNDTTQMASFIKNSTASINAGGKDSYQAKLFEKWHNIQMPSFNGLTDDQIKSIIRYFGSGATD